jgi:hypothetical protein
VIEHAALAHVTKFQGLVLVSQQNVHTLYVSVNDAFAMYI